MFKEKKQIEQMVYSQTPIDIIQYIHEGRNFLEVTGFAGRDSITYRFYNNGTVVKNNE